MLPTGRDIECIAEIRRSRRREAEHYRMLKLTKKAPSKSKLQVLRDRIEQDLKIRSVKNNESPVSSQTVTRLGESS
jgi:hypothetical protein